MRWRQGRYFGVKCSAVISGPTQRGDARQEFLLHGLWVTEGALREHLPELQALAADDLVDPLLLDLERAQLVGEVVDVAAGDEVGRRALQHGDVAGVVGDRRDQGRGRGARADDHHRLALAVEVFRPGLRVDDLPLEVGHAGPLGRVANRMPVVALAHPEEVRREGAALAGVGALGDHGPERVGARPGGRKDLVAIADVAREVVLLDHLAYVGEDFLAAGDRRANPGLEAVAEGVKVAV